MRIAAIVLTGAIAAVSVLAVNHLRVNAAASAATEPHDFRAMGYYRMGVIPGDIVFDMRDIDAAADFDDVMSAFLDFAEQLQEREISRVHIAHRGRTRFLLDGEVFGEIGSAGGWYSDRELADRVLRHVRHADGSPFEAGPSDFDRAFAFFQGWYIQDIQGGGR